MKTIEETVQYLKDGLNLFLKDPADSDYQKGYHACMLEVKKFIQNKS